MRTFNKTIVKTLIDLPMNEVLGNLIDLSGHFLNATLQNGTPTYTGKGIKFTDPDQRFEIAHNSLIDGLQEFSISMNINFNSFPDPNSDFPVWNIFSKFKSEGGTEWLAQVFPGEIIGYPSGVYTDFGFAQQSAGVESLIGQIDRLFKVDINLHQDYNFLYIKEKGSNTNKIYFKLNGNNVDPLSDYTYLKYHHSVPTSAPICIGSTNAGGDDFPVKAPMATISNIVLSNINP